MSESLRGYRRTHGDPVLALPILERVRSDERTPEGLARLKGPLGLPDAALRGAASYYADLSGTRAGPRICAGTSCRLSARTPPDPSAARAYCLGYCDRAPVRLEADGRVVVHADDPAASRDRPGPPDIRCAARTPIVTRRIGAGDFSSLEAARSDGAYDALRAALERPPEDVITRLETSGERGRGGAGFPTGTKWRRCAASGGDDRVIIANGDEGDPGSFIDRVLMEQDPHGVLEGLALGAYAVRARHGIVFVRSEYPEARRRLVQAVRDATEAGILGASVLGRGFSLDVTVVSGLGSYVCGEETAMLDALEGGRGEVRMRPPYPTEAGLFGRPTVVDNVETLVNVPWIIAHGARAYAALGTSASSGTKAICLNRGFARPGIVEVEFGRTLADVIARDGGGGRDGRPLAAVLLGGPMGSVLRPDAWDVPICFAAMAERGIRLGHGGLVAVPEDVDLHGLLRHWLRFMADESCGKCVPCGLGSARAAALAEAHGAEDADHAWRAELDRQLATISATSLCAFGRELPRPVRQILAWMDGAES